MCTSLGWNSAAEPCSTHCRLLHRLNNLPLMETTVSTNTASVCFWPGASKAVTNCDQSISRAPTNSCTQQWLSAKALALVLLSSFCSNMFAVRTSYNDARGIFRDVASCVILSAPRSHCIAGFFTDGTVFSVRLVQNTCVALSGLRISPPKPARWRISFQSTAAHGVGTTLLSPLLW